VARELVTDGIKATGEWYRLEPIRNIGPGSMCEHCCGWGHLES